MSSIRDRVALIYTSAGSQREVARRLGISHQKVGRILKLGQEGGYRPDAKALQSPELRAAVDRGYAEHKRIVKAQAKRDGIPYRDAAPVFQRRLPIKVTTTVVDRRTGEMKRVPVIDPATGRQQTRPGERIEAPNLHWLSDAQRASFVRAMHSTGKFAGVSVQSLVNLKAYFRRAEANMRGTKRTDQQKQWRQELRDRIKAQEAQSASMLTELYTKAVPMDFGADRVIKEVNKQLAQKHEPASGSEFPGTQLAKSILLQIDTRTDNEKPAAKKGTKKARKTR